MTTKFQQKVWTLVNRWEKIYRKEVQDNDYLPLPFALVDYSASSEEIEVGIERAEDMLDMQINFLKFMISFMILDCEEIENLDRIKTFLLYQHYEDKYLPENRDPAFCITFQGGCYRYPVMVNVERLGEFDFADSWSEVRYEIIGVSNNRWKTWTQRRIDNVIEHIKDDFEFDGYHAAITIESGWAGIPARDEMSLGCLVTE